MEVRPREAQLSPNSKLWGFQLWGTYSCLVGEPRSREWNCPNNGLAGSSTCVTFSCWLRLRPRSFSLLQAELAQGPFPSPLFFKLFDIRPVECDGAISQLWDGI